MKDFLKTLVFVEVLAAIVCLLAWLAMPVPLREIATVLVSTAVARVLARLIAPVLTWWMKL